MRCQHITLKERYVIYHLRLMRLIFREIGRRSGRHPMTISREVKRNGPVRGMYWDQSVQDRAMERRKRPRHWRRSSNTSLVGYVHACLCQDWSPATFCARLTLEFPRNQRMRISAEGIYRWIYQDAAQGGALYRHLPGRHKKRRRFGHWEGDSVKGLKGLKGSSGIAAYVERKSRLLLAGKLADKRAMTLNQTAQRLFAQMPTKWKKSLTVDNGKEFALFRQIEKDTGRSVYFADPYSPGSAAPTKIRTACYAIISLRGLTGKPSRIKRLQPPSINSTIDLESASAIERLSKSLSKI